jgi:hypothetical protein
MIITQILDNLPTNQFLYIFDIDNLCDLFKKFNKNLLDRKKILKRNNRPALVDTHQDGYA